MSSEKIGFYPDYRLPETESALDSVRYDIPSKSDLTRKLVTDSPAIKTLTDQGLNGRTYFNAEKIPHPVYTTVKGRSEIYSRHPDHHNESELGNSTPGDEEIYQLEDRVKDKTSGEVHHFDRLPEVAELQYRLSAMPVINEIMKTHSGEAADEEFRKYKRGLVLSSYGSEEPQHKFLRPSVNENRKYDGFSSFAPEDFWISERHGGPDIPQWDDNASSYHVKDHFEQSHKNVTQGYIAHAEEGIKEHLTGLTDTYNKLWDKLDSGEYERHPNFWSGHAFAHTNQLNQKQSRTRARDQMKKQAPETELKFN